MESKKNQLLESCEKTFKEILDLLKKKNSDYAGEADTYKNFIDPELQAYLDKHKTGLDAVELGIRIRMKDKWARLNTLLFSDKPPSVTSESLDDTLSDVIGYAGIWKAWREHKKPKPFLSALTTLPANNGWSTDKCGCSHFRFEHTPILNKCDIDNCGCQEFKKEEI